MSEKLPERRPQLNPSLVVGGLRSTPVGSPAEVEEGVPLKERLAVLRRHAWLIAGVTVLSVGVAGYRVYHERPLYTANAVLRLADTRQAMTGGLEAAAMEQALGRGTDPLLSQIQVLRSRGVASSVVDSLGLRLQSTSPDFRPSLLSDVVVAPQAGPDTVRLAFAEEGYSASLGSREQQASYGQPVDLGTVSFAVAERPAVENVDLVVRSRNAAAQGLIEGVSARPKDRTNVVDVTYTSHDPELAQRVVNAVALAFQRENVNAARQQSRRRRLFVEEQLRTTDSVLTTAQSALSSFRGREQVYSSREKYAAEQAGLMGIEVRREELAADQRMFASLLTRLAQNGGQRRATELQTLVASPGVASNPVVAQLYEQLVQYETARDSLTAGGYGSAASNPDVRRLDALVTSTEAKLVNAVRSHVAVLGARITALDELRSRSAAQMAVLPGTEAEEVQLVQQVETVRKVADQLREELQKARISEAVEAGQVEIVDLATVPEQPIGSGRGRKLFFGLVVGLLLGGGGAFFLDRMNTSIRRREELESILKVPGLAVIPRFMGAAGAASRLRLPGRRGAAQLVPAGAGDELVTVGDARSSGAEAYRTLRTNLIFSQAVQTLRTVVVTSASPGEGKTTTTSNLAVTFAQQGMRVLLIDCDLRKARLHKVFGVEREPGLTQFMLGHSTLADVIRQTPVEGLSVLPSGTLPPNPSELLGGDRMRDTLRTLAEHFDLLILDTPPLLAAADAAVLGTRADGVLLVVRAGGTERGAAQQALQQLAAVGAHVVGAVLNDPDAKVPQYGGYYQYDYYGADD